MKAILAKKIGMTTIFETDGTSVAVTLLQAGPCQVTLVRPMEKWTQIQLGFGEKKEKNMTKAELGHLKDLPHFRTLKEFRYDKTVDMKRGDVVDVNIFKVGEFVDVIGTSKGKGFQGVVRRHHFRGGPRTHGSKHSLRAPGSIGSGWPQHVIKGMRMAGRMGCETVTQKGLKVVDVVPNTNILVIRGAVPGAKNALLSVRGK